LDVTVNGQPAQVVNQIGWPGATEVYRVDIVVPNGASSGLARVRISAAWIPGPDFLVPIR